MSRDSFDYSHLPLQRESDLEHPFQWFDDLIIIDQPHRFKNNFYSDADQFKDYNLIKHITEDAISYDSENKIDGHPIRSNFTYSSFLNHIITYQKRRSKELIFKKIENCSTTDQAKFIIQKMIDRLGYLVGLLKKHRNYPIREFSSIPLGVYDLINYIQEAHRTLLPNPLPDIFIEAQNPSLIEFSNLLDPEDDILDVKKKEDITEKQFLALSNESKGKKEIKTDTNIHLKHTVKSFSWVFNSNQFTLSLYKIFITRKVIDMNETDFLTFSQAFNGSEITHPLEIKWHLMSSQKSYKAPIIRIINYLSVNLNLLNIDTTKVGFSRQVENIFVDPKGNKFISIQASLAEIGNKPSIHETVLLKDLAQLKSVKKDI